MLSANSIYQHAFLSTDCVWISNRDHFLARIVFGFRQGLVIYQQQFDSFPAALVEKTTEEKTMEGGASSEPSWTTLMMGNISELAIDSEYIIPSSLAQIAPILRVANEIELDNPRVAYLCRVYAFEKAHRFDPTSNGRGVRQFKTALLQRLERDAEPSLHARRKESDAIEMLSFYEQHYANFVKALDNATEQADRAQMAKAYQTTAILFELLKQFTQSADVASEIMEADKNVEKKTELYLPFDIHSLDPTFAHQAIMELPEEREA